MAAKTVVCLVALGVVWSAQLEGHHAVSTVYDVGRTTTLLGVVDRVVIRRPHPIVHVIEGLEGGGRRTWVVEVDDPDKRRADVGVSTLEPGNRVMVCGNPGRDPGGFKLRLLSLTRQSDAFVLRSDVAMDESTCSG